MADRTVGLRLVVGKRLEKFAGNFTFSTFLSVGRRST